ncbi:MAG: AraC family transcriptional regulator [Clostridia bacterium]|nr:AraC family transcriptional regulator [Clostridia bacterium]
MTQTEHSVEEIAFEVGFSSRRHFCTVFKREMGCSPKKYQTVATM